MFFIYHTQRVRQTFLIYQNTEALIRYTQICNDFSKKVVKIVVLYKTAEKIVAVCKNV